MIARRLSRFGFVGPYGLYVHADTDDNSIVITTNQGWGLIDVQRFTRDDFVLITELTREI